MSLVLTALALLSLGAAAALLLARVPRLALNLAMASAFVSAALVVFAAGDALLNSASRTPYEIDWPLALGTARLSLDGLSAWFLLTIGVLAGCVAVYSVPYMGAGVGREPLALFGALFCVLLGAMILLVCAADAVLFLIGWEVMTLSAFLLVDFHDERPEARRGAWTYLVATHIGTALFVLPLFGILFARAGTTAFSSFDGAAGSADSTTLVTLFVLGVAGFGTKAGFMPMHVWLPAAHPVAPTAVSALLSGVVVKTGIYGLVRLLSWLPPLPLVCGEVFLLVSVASGVMGVLYALAQHDLKSLLAYHTVENIGIIGLGLSMGLIGEATDEPALAVLGYAGALLHMTNHALFKGLLFLSAGAVLHGSGTGNLERLGGLARKTPINSLMFLLGAVAICGLPPLNGFLSEWVIFGSLFGGAVRGIGASAALAAVGVAGLALMGGLALACFAKVFGVVFLGEPRDAAVGMHATPAGMKAAMVVLAALCALIGVLPGLWFPLVRSATGILANVPVDEVASRVESTLAPAIRLSWLAAVFIAAIGGLLLVRRTVCRIGDVAPMTATWGCGYALPTPRMQYTASSFAAFLVTTFRGLLWPVRTAVVPTGVFAARSHLETHAPDIVEHDLLEPIFHGLARLFAMVRTVSWRGAMQSAPATVQRRGSLRTLLDAMVSTLRRGSIQVRLLFIVLTLVVLFLVEAMASGDRTRDRSTTVSVHLEREGRSMTAVRAILFVPEMLVALTLPPLLMSVIAKTKAWFGGRIGPPWLQPYFDLHKLIQKHAVYSRMTTWYFRAGPIVSLAALLTSVTLIPVLTNTSLLGFSGDVILLAYLFALARMFTVLAAMDTGSSFEGMGASREVTFGAMSEPALFLAFVVMAVATKSLQLSVMIGPRLSPEWGIAGPAMILVVAALGVILLAETCRVPVDDPATHLELTMIHEVMVLDHSGPEFAFITYGAALKFTLLGSILVHAAIPHPEGMHVFGAALRIVELGGVAVVVGVIESVTARFRLDRVPMFLAGATVLSAIAVVLVLMRRSA